MLALGLDIGGTKTALGLIDLDTGSILSRNEFATPPREARDPEFFQEICRVARSHGPLPLGIGICELVDRAGEIKSSHTIPWTSAEVRSFFSEFPSVTIEADVRAAARAEARFGGAKQFTHWIYANAGTGVGAVLMDREKPYFGHSGLGMAFGMSPSSFEAEHVRTLEDIAGTRGMTERAQSTSFRSLVKNTPNHTILQDGGSALGRALGTLANMLDPEAMVIGGGAVAASETYFDAAENAIHKVHWFSDHTSMGVRRAKLGSDSGLIGAALITDI